jgi:hypothetical protein
VRTRAGHVNHHSRLPGYAQGKRGTIARLHGAHVFADANAQGLGEQPQWLYTVVFDGRTLWGADAQPGLQVSVDAWESYLQPDDGAAHDDGSGHLPRPAAGDDDAPVFAEPWMAQAFAMVLQLHQKGLFTWPEWAAALAAQITARPGRRAMPTWATPTTTTGWPRWKPWWPPRARRRPANWPLCPAWDHAADRTPHGQPIELQPRDFDPA